MSWMAALTAVGMVGRGFMGMSNVGRVEDMIEAAKGIYEEEKNLLTRSNTLTTNKLAHEFDMNSQKLGMQTGQSFSKNRDTAAAAQEKAGFASHGTIKSNLTKQQNNLWDSYQREMDNISSLHKFGKTQQDITFAQSRAQIEQRYQDRMAQAEAIPTGFLEGMFS